jgi:peptide/nickel transport system permease protein
MAVTFHSLAAKPVMILAGVLLLAVLFAGAIAPCGYDSQDREAISAGVSHGHPLGTDDLGRDRLSRLLFGLRTSLLAASAAAALTIVLGAAIGTAAAIAPPFLAGAVLSMSDLVLSLPWFFLLVILRAALPLSAPPAESMVLTFAALGLIGWPVPARLVRDFLVSQRRSKAVRYAVACGMAEPQAFRSVALGGVFSVLVAQFLIFVPAYVVAEANLGILGLGITEPMPSMGGMLRSLVSSRSGSFLDWLPIYVMVFFLSAGQIGSMWSKRWNAIACRSFSS